MAERDVPWNHNIHYHRLVLDRLEPGTRSVLDVGCGEGMLCRTLRERVPRVVGLDRDRASIDLARLQDPRGGIDYRCEDLLTADLAPGSFDLVCSVATLHHLDPVEALRRMAELVRPGGRLVVIGLARSRPVLDLHRDLAAAVAHRAHRVRGPVWRSPSPTIWPPPHTYAQMRRLAEETLPGVVFRRHLLWRYSLVWTRPRPDARSY